MAQFGRPDQDITLNSWTDQDGNTTSIYTTIDETSASDSDYIKVVAADSMCEIGLGSLTDPGVDTGHVIRFRMYGTGAAAAEKLTVELRMGASFSIAVDANNQSDGAWGDFSLTLSEAQAALITDYSDLRLRFTSTGNTGGSDEIRCSWAELEIPTPVGAPIVDVNSPVTVGTDSVNLKIVLNINVASTITVASVAQDLNVFDKILDVNVSEPITVASVAQDLDVFDKVLDVNVSEPITVAEFEEITVSPLSISVFEPITVAEDRTVSVSGAAVLTIDVSEPITVTELEEITVSPLSLSVFDSITVTEDATPSIPTQVYYSISKHGTANLLTGGSPTIVVDANGDATLTLGGATLADNIGQGVAVVYNSITSYIDSITSTTSFHLVTALGANAASQSSTAVTSINHEWQSLADAEAAFTDASHIDDTSLVTADVVVNIACYYDHEDFWDDVNSVTVDFGTDDATRYLRIYTPRGIAFNESINNQRPSEIWDTNKWRLSHALIPFKIRQGWTRIEGLQIETKPSTDWQAVIIVQSLTDAGGQDIYIDKCILRQTNAQANTRGILLGAGGPITEAVIVNIRNCIVYGTTDSGITTNDTDVTTKITNSTVYNCTLGINNISANSVTVKNSAVFGNTNDFNGTITIENCATFEGAGVGTDGQTLDDTDDYANEFVDVTTGDFRLVGGGVCEENGQDTSAEGVTDDIRGIARPISTNYDIGAFEGLTILAVDVSDSITVAEFEEITGAGAVDIHSVDVNDPITITEDVTLVIPELFVDVIDSITVAEELHIGTELIVDVLDSITVAEFEEITVSPLSINVVDTITVAEELHIGTELIVDVFDSITVATDVATLSVSGVIVVDVLDSITVAELEEITVSPLTIDVVDSITVAEDVDIGTELIVDVVDAITVTELEEITVSPLSLAVVDSITVAEDVSIGTELIVDVFDEITVAEDNALSIIAVHVIDVADPITVTELEEITVSPLSLAVVDSITVTDLATLFLPKLNVVAIDTITVDEVEEITVSLLSLNVDDTITVLDPVTVSRSGAAPNVSVVDTITVTELEEITVSPLTIDRFESITVTELEEITVSPLFLSVSDPITVAEELHIGTELIVDVFDSITVAELEEITVSPLDIDVADSVTVGEAEELVLPELYLSVADTITVVDVPTLTVTGVAPNVNVFDAITVAELEEITISPLSLSVADTLTITDPVTLVLPELNLDVFDAITVAEDVSIGTELLVDAVDTITVSDIATASVIGVLSIDVVDSITVTDVATVVLPTLNVTVNDTVTIADPVTLLLPQLNLSVFDTITVSDVATSNIPIDLLSIDVSDSVSVEDTIDALIDLLVIDILELITVLDIPTVVVGIPIFFTADDVGRRTFTMDTDRRIFVQDTERRIFSLN